MALSSLISPLFLLSLVVISSAIPDYETPSKNQDNSNVYPEKSEYNNEGHRGHHFNPLYLDYLVKHLLHGKKNTYYKPQVNKNEDEFSVPRENPEYDVPANEKPEEDYVPETEFIGVEGFVLCKSGSGYTPIKGARAIIKCHNSYASEYNNGYYVTSSETNEEGCYVAALLKKELEERSMNVKDCKAYHEYSPMDTCNDVVVEKNGEYLTPLANKNYYYSGNLVYASPSPSNNYDQSAQPNQDSPAEVKPHY